MVGRGSRAAGRLRLEAQVFAEWIDRKNGPAGCRRRIVARTAAERAVVRAVVRDAEQIWRWARELEALLAQGWRP